MGTGGPTVVLEAGLTASAAPWSGVIPAIASFTRVVSYDRPNTTAGASDPAPVPRTAADIVTDLHALLDAADVPGPYVLVGHSVGGLFVRLYASRYPDDVAGLVLVDSSHEDQDERRRPLVSPELFAAEQQAVHANTEGIDLDASFAQVREARAAAPLRSMPLVVLSAGQADPAGFPEGWPMDAEARLHDELQGTWPDSSPVVGTSSPSRAGTTSSRASPTWWSRRSARWSRRSATRAPGKRTRAQRPSRNPADLQTSRDRVRVLLRAGQRPHPRADVSPG